MAAGINNDIYFYFSFFIPTDELRYAELKRSLIINSLNPYIKIIVLLCETEFPEDLINNKDLRFHKIILEIGEKRRPTYKDFLILFNKYNPSGINIIGNSDIILDHRDTQKIFEIKNDEMWGLTRYEVNCNLDDKKYLDFSNIPTKDFPYVHPRLIWTTCTDIWIFRGSFIKSDDLPEIELGIPKCDGFFNRYCLDVGYKIYNFGLDIKSYHYHSEKKRNYPYIYPKGNSVLMLPTLLKNKDKMIHYQLKID